MRIMNSSVKTLKDVYRHIKTTLQDAGIEDFDLEARYIILHRSGYDFGEIIAKPDIILDSDLLLRITEDVEKRLSRMPISRIYGEREFWGIKFDLSPDTLDPRPDTETILELSIERLDRSLPLRILDLGTGTGCILIALLHEFKNASGVGVDLSAGAVKTASSNALQANVQNRVSFVQGSWFSPVEGLFDLIVSNPPYISNQVIPTLTPEVRNHDPILALDGGGDGLDAYRSIFSLLKNYLSPSGLALFEIGYDQCEQVSRLAEEYSLSVRGVHLDLAGQPRVVEISCGDK